MEKRDIDSLVHALMKAKPVTASGKHPLPAEEDLPVARTHLELLVELARGLEHADQEQSALACPECARGMSVVRLGGVALDSCRFCRSIWFDAGELMAVSGLSSDVPSETLRDRPSRLSCPVCGVAMKEYIFRAPDNLLVDQCAGRHGVYLQGGELARVFRMLKK